VLKLEPVGKESRILRLVIASRNDSSIIPFSAGETFGFVSRLASPAYQQKHMTELNQWDEQPPSTGGIPA
jgi:hypothetical protein